jgi:hypothetical protein
MDGWPVRGKFIQRLITHIERIVASGVPARYCVLCFCASGILLPAPAPAQSFRDLVASARLGSGYAQMLNLAATPDISAAHFNIQDGESRPSLDVVRVPYEPRWFDLSKASGLYWKMSGGYLRLDDEFLVNIPSIGAGSISSQWSAYSVTGGLFIKMTLGKGITFAPALDLGVAQLDNRASYQGAAAAVQPLVDGLLFNWRTNATLVTPNAGLEWTHSEDAHRISIRGHIAWSWISSFGESDPVLKFNETAGVYSVRAERIAPARVRLLGREIDWVLNGGYAGFHGANRQALGFTSVAEIGAGIEAPISAGREKSNRLRVGASYLFGPKVEGWTISLGLRF